MRFAQTGIPDKDKVGGAVDPGGVYEGHNILFADFRIEVPVELTQRFDLFYPGGPQEPFDLMLSSILHFRPEKLCDNVVAVRRDLLERGSASEFCKQGFKILFRHRIPPVLLVYT
jgi:hypothetical protein